MTAPVGLRLARPTDAPPDRLAAMRSAMAAIRAERVAYGLDLIVKLQEWCAEVSDREAGHLPGVAEAGRRLLRPLNLEELGIKRLTERSNG